MWWKAKYIFECICLERVSKLNRIIPVIILFVIVIVGVVSYGIKLVAIRRRYDFTERYYCKLNDYLDSLIDNRAVDEELHYELTKDVKKMQHELGTDGIFAYVQDNLMGYSMNNYPLLVNMLSETHDWANDLNGLAIFCERYDQEMQQCRDMFVRHLGTLETKEEVIRKSLFNPFSNFSEGVRTILSLPIQLLESFGLLKAPYAQKIKSSAFSKIISMIVTVVSFVSGAMAIIMGWSDFWEFIRNMFIK